MAVFKKPLTKLKDIDLAEVSLVNRGANLKKRFPIVKQEELMDEEIIQNVLKTEVEEESVLVELLAKSEIDERAVPVLKKAMRILVGFKDTLPKDTLNILKVAGGFPMGDMQEDEEEDPMPKAKDKKKKKRNEEHMSTEVEGLTEEVKKQIEEITKAQTVQLDALKAENERISKCLAEEQASRELGVWKERVSKDLSHFPGQSFDELADTLKKMHSLDPEIAEKQFANMKSASDAIKSSSLLREAGGSYSGGNDNSFGGDSWDKIEKLAEGLVEKSDDLSLTHAKAVDKIMHSEKGQQLYKQYLEEHTEQNN